MRYYSVIGCLSVGSGCGEGNCCGRSRLLVVGWCVSCDVPNDDFVDDGNDLFNA